MHGIRFRLPHASLQKLKNWENHNNDNNSVNFKATGSKFCVKVDLDCPQSYLQKYTILETLKNLKIGKIKIMTIIEPILMVFSVGIV